MTASPGISDEQLVQSASQGDREAFGALYERYHRNVYDLSVRMVRDPDTAADIVQETFVNAWENLHKRTVTGNIKAWLYTIGRNNAINELRRGKRHERVQESDLGAKPPPFFAKVDPDRTANPETALEDQELVDLVWNSAAALSPKEYALLDLHLRRGLSTDELSSTLGVSRGNLYTTLSRLRDSLEQSVTVGLLARRGRGECPQLDAILAGRPSGDLDRQLRRQVSQHLDECSRCQASRHRYLAPAEIFAGLALVPIPVGLDLALWPRIAAVIGAGAGVVGGILSPIGNLVEQAARWWGGKAAAIRDGTLASSAVAVGVLVAITLVIVSPGGGTNRNLGGVLGVSQPPRGDEEMPPPTRDESRTPVTLDVAPQPTPTPTAAATPQPALVPVAAPTRTPLPGTPPVSTPTPVPTPPPPTPDPMLLVKIKIKVRESNDLEGTYVGGNVIFQAVVYGTNSFATVDIDPSTVKVGGAAGYGARYHDDNGDGLQDLILYFRISDSGLAPGDTQICLNGQTFNGRRFQGCDVIRIPDD